MEIARGDLQLQLAPLRLFIAPNIIKALPLTKSLDPKIVKLVDASWALFSHDLTTPLEFIKKLTPYVVAITLINKLYHRSPKPLTQIFAKTITLTTISCCPYLIVKLALFTIRSDARINMNDRKERTLYIISSIAIAALMAPHFLKIHRKTYTFYPKGVAQLALAQMVVHIAVAEIFDWNDRSIAEEIKPLSNEWTKSLVKYQAVGPKTETIIDRKLDETQKEINEALLEYKDWEPWMDTAPIKEYQTNLPDSPNPKFATFVYNHPELLEKLPILKQIEWNQSFNEMKKALVFPTPLAHEYLPLIKGDNLFLFHKYFQDTPFFFLLSKTDQQSINQRFSECNCATIQPLDLSLFSLELQHRFYAHETEHVPDEYKWSSLSFLEKYRKNTNFDEEGLKQLPLF